MTGLRLPRIAKCYMFEMWTRACAATSAGNSALDPALEAALLTEGPRPVSRLAVCGKPWLLMVKPIVRQPVQKAAHREQQQEYMRKKAGLMFDRWGQPKPLTRLFKALFCRRYVFYVPALFDEILSTFVRTLDNLSQKFAL